MKAWQVDLHRNSSFFVLYDPHFAPLPKNLIIYHKKELHKQLRHQKNTEIKNIT